jgi:hypothetical protein
MAGSAQRATQPDLGANQEGDRPDRHLSLPVLNRQARQLADELGVHVSGSKLRKIVRNFINDGRTAKSIREALEEYAEGEHTYVTPHRDPVGNKVAREVDANPGALDAIRKAAEIRRSREVASLGVTPDA